MPFRQMLGDRFIVLGKTKWRMRQPSHKHEAPASLSFSVLLQGVVSSQMQVEWLTAHYNNRQRNRNEQIRAVFRALHSIRRHQCHR